MAFPKGPPKSSSSLTFWLLVAAAALLLLLLWGWQAGVLNHAGHFVKGLFEPAQYTGYGRERRASSERPNPDADDARRQAEIARKAEEDGEAAKRLEAEDKADAGKEAALKAQEEAEAKAAAEKEADDRAAEEKAAAAQAEADRLAADLAKEEAAGRRAVEASMPPLRDPKQAVNEDGRGRRKGRLKRAPDDASEAAVNREIGKVLPLAQVRRFFNLQEQARRAVITVDNLPREHVPSQMRAAREVPGLMRVKKDGDSIVLDERNYERYDNIIGFVESLDVAKVAQLYAKFYPLLQRTYEEMGYPDERFQDRVMVAIDDMISAPSPRGKIRLVQPKVLYRFEDNWLENLSAGQKIMVRVGPQNSARLRKVLARLRGALAAQDPDLKDRR